MKVGFTRRVNIMWYIVFIWYEVVYFFRSMNIGLQVKKIYYKLLRVLTIIISKVTVSVSKYKPLNYIKYLCDNCCFFYNVVLSSSNSWEYTMCLLALGADIMNRSQCYSHVCQDVGQRECVYFKLILKDVKHSREILQVSESQADVLFTSIQSSDPVASRRVQSKIDLFTPILLVTAHGLAYPR